MTHALDGRVSLVTGGATGIGRSVALALASHGSRVVVNDKRSAAEAEQVVAAIHGVAYFGDIIQIQVI